jgi:ADP-ribosylglycohydrolase
VPAGDDRDRIRGALLGLAVADALGAPLEGVAPRVAVAVVGRGLEMTGGGWWAPGEWTDDTAMALALAESIAARGLLDTDDLAARYIAWATGGGKGIGRATASALVGAGDADDAWARARAHLEATGLAARNGTIMRATPIGLAARGLEAAVAAARHDAQLTHADPVTGDASAALCPALLARRHGGDPLRAVRDQAADERPLAVALGAVGRDERALARLAGGPEAGACATTLALALHALAAGYDYEHGVRWVIARGRDTDTNTAVAGALLGCPQGIGAIPERWLAALRDRQRIERAAQGLLVPPEHGLRPAGAPERVSFPGWVGDPAPYIAGATVLAIPSRDEAFSQTAIIGLAHGVPVIGTEVDGLPATLGGGCGILVPPEDPQALAAALERVLHDELPRPRPLRSLAERHAPARVAAIYESTYRGLVAPEAVGAQAVS